MQDPVVLVNLVGQSCFWCINQSHPFTLFVCNKITQFAKLITYYITPYIFGYNNIVFHNLWFYDIIVVRTKAVRKTLCSKQKNTA